MLQGRVGPESERLMVGNISVEKATLYEMYRLSYADEMIDDLLERIGGARDVADIGAGTGQLARGFASRCPKVYAVEPDPAMREVASAALADLARIEIVAGVAEQIPLAGNSVDLVVVGNAFHRFKPEACGELRRILRQQGWIALITYEITDMALTEMLSSKPSALTRVAARREKTWHQVPVRALFEDARIHALSYRQSHTKGWTAFLGAACAGIEAPTRDDEDYAAFEALHREVFEAFVVDGSIQIDYETRVSFGQP
jgi:ubiquinone/menaquinone biosynthesis C-methylase UbiE